MLGLEIHEAASTGDYDCLEELVTSGKFDVNLGDEDWGNKTPLHWAAQKGYVECIRLLLEYGAKGTARTDTGWTPAHFAAEAGKLTAIRALYNGGVSVSRRDTYGSTPRRVAEVYNHTECYKFLSQVEDLDEAESEDEAEEIETTPPDKTSTNHSHKSSTSQSHKSSNKMETSHSDKTSSQPRKNSTPSHHKGSHRT